MSSLDKSIINYKNLFQSIGIIKDNLNELKKDLDIEELNFEFNIKLISDENLEDVYDDLIDYYTETISKQIEQITGCKVHSELIEFKDNGNPKIRIVLNNK